MTRSLTKDLKIKNFSLLKNKIQVCRKLLILWYNPWNSVYVYGCFGWKANHVINNNQSKNELKIISNSKTERQVNDGFNANMVQ